MCLQFTWCYMFLTLTTTSMSAKYKTHKSWKFYPYLKFLIEGNVSTAHLVLPSPALISQSVNDGMSGSSQTTSKANISPEVPRS